MAPRGTAKTKRHTKVERPPSKLIFVLGGASSGKSSFALNICGPATPRAFLATGEPLDTEMNRRIRAHKKARGKEWQTVEIPLHMAEWFSGKGSRYSGVVVDCLTLWLSNLLREGVRSRQILVRLKELLHASRAVPGHVVMVSNELGLGLVPGDPHSRQFRTLAGQVNQRVAEAADEVYFVVSGIPLRLK